MHSACVKSRLHLPVPELLRSRWRRLQSSPLAYRFAKGALWSLAGTCISRLLGLCASVFVARMLGTTGFGEWGVIQNTIGMLGMFAGFGLGLTTTKYVGELRLKDAARAGRIIGLSGLVAWVTGGVMALVLLFSAEWLSVYTLSAPHLCGVLRCSSVLLLLGAINGVQTGTLAGLEAFKRLANINIIAGMSSFPLMLLGTYWWGLCGAVWGLVASQAQQCMLNHMALRDEARKAGMPLGSTGKLREIRVIWEFSFPALLNGIAVGPVQWACTTILVNQRDGYAEMGLFNAANQWFNVLLFFPAVFGQAALPVLAECQGQNDSRSSGQILIHLMKFNAAAVTPLVLVACAASYPIMLSYGRTFGPGWPVLVVIALTAEVLAAQYCVGHFLIASGKLWLGFAMNLGWGLVFLGLTYCFISRGALGLASARLVAYVLHAFWTFGFAAYMIRKARGDCVTSCVVDSSSC